MMPHLTSDARQCLDNVAGLYNELFNSKQSWTEFLEAEHELVHKAWPELREALIDARRWENPVSFDGSFASLVERKKPLPALTTVGHLERVALRALVMFHMDREQREELIRRAWEAETAARKSAAEQARPHKPESRLGVDDLDLSSIKL